MGRKKYSNRLFADYVPKLEIWQLKKYGYLVDGWHSDEMNLSGSFPSRETKVHILADVNSSDPKLWITSAQDRTAEQEIRLITSGCYFGGRRFWFFCPDCYRRVGVLYQLNYLFSCRLCLDLRYKSRNWSHKLRNDTIFKALNNLIKIQRLQAGLKRYTYAGLATKKQRRLDWLHAQLPFL